MRLDPSEFLVAASSSSALRATHKKTPRAIAFRPPPRLEWKENGADAFASGLRSEEGRSAWAAGAFAPLREMLGQRGWFVAHPVWQEEKMHFHAWHSDAFMSWPRQGPRQKCDALSDLTALHEWMHMATLPAGFESERAWRRAFRANEIAVSLETEVLVRWRAPGLQRAALGSIAYWADEIQDGFAAWMARPGHAERAARWAESLAESADEQAMRAEFASAFLMGPAPKTWPEDWTPERLWDARRQVSLWPLASSKAETQIALYESGSEGWMDQWVDLAPQVEANRQKLREALSAGRAAEGWAAFSETLSQSMGELQVPWESHMMPAGARATLI